MAFQSSLTVPTVLEKEALCIGSLNKDQSVLNKTL